MKFILWCNQEGNAQTRSLLIPADLLNKKRREQLEELKRYRIKECKEYNVILIDHVYSFDSQGNKIGVHVSERDKRADDIVVNISYYADWSHQYCLDKEDEVWAFQSFDTLCRGFNHIKNFKELLTLKEWKGVPIEIVDSFLILESKNGVQNQSPWDTSEEMMLDLYGIQPNNK